MKGKYKQKKNFAKDKSLSSRKDLRKQLRKEKKAKKNDYFKNKKKNALIKNSPSDRDGAVINKNKLVNKNSESLKRSPTMVEKVKVNSKPKLSSLEEQSKLHRQEVREKAKLERGMIKQRKKILLEANENEDKEIKKLEKHLKLNKRKSKAIPKSFTEEGLDYLLEVCDTDRLMDAANVEMNLQESGSEFEDDFAIVTNKKKRKAELNEEPFKKKKSFSELKAEPLKKKKSFSASSSEHETSGDDDQLLSDEELQDSDEDLQDSDEEIQDEDLNPHDEEDFTESDVDSGSQHSGSEVESTANSENDIGNPSEVKKPKKELWEDIYGRTRDKEGNVIQVNDTGKYVPPHLRAQHLAQDAKKLEELTRLKKQLKGLINRLAVSNMHSICNQIDELYMRNSRNDMNDTLLSLITEALVGPVLTAERLVMEHAMLIAILHANVGMEVGAHFLQNFVQKFDTLYKKGPDVENKELDNVVLIISHLYNFKVFHAVLMYNILDKLAQQFTEKEVELILLVLRSVGFSLRKDDPLALKGLVLNLQKKANESNHLRDNPRVRFMLDVLLAVKNNNMSKIPLYDPSHSENLKKLLKTMIHKSKYVTELKVTLEDLLKADERGRWWIVGSAWSGAPSSTAPAPTSQTAPESQFSQSVLDLARKQRINTDTRRNIFCILMTAEDYLDAFEKLLRLGLKAQQEQEIIHVLVHCLLQEKQYNPYYAHLATHFCQADRKHQMTLQYHLWDRLKELSKLSQSQITNFSKFLADLFLEKALPISVLKVMQFSEMDKHGVRLLRQVLLSVLLYDSTEVLAAVFTRVSQSDKLHMFRESLRLFLHHFVLRNVSDLDTDQAGLLKERVRLAETALTKTDTSRRNFF